jgi:cytoskeleton protein RodZ
MPGITLGNLLRQKRESLGLTLEKVEGFTHIRVRHLEAIEADDLSSIPSVPQARGFIRNYAAFLGVSPEEIAALGAGNTRPRPAKTSEKPPDEIPPEPRPAAPPAAFASTSATPAAPAKPARLTTPVVSRRAAYAGARPAARAPARNIFRADTLLGIGVTAVVVALLGWGGYNVVMSLRGATPAATVPGPADLDTPTATLVMEQTALATETGISPAEGETPGAGDGTPASPPAVTPGEVSIALSPTAFPTPLGGVYTDVRIHIIVVLNAYLQVDVDGKPAFAGRVQPGEKYDYIGRTTVAISTGNGAGIRVIFNGVDEGTMGRFGEVVTQTYTPAGILTPVPPPTVTPTITPAGTVTPAP